MSILSSVFGQLVSGLLAQAADIAFRAWLSVAPRHRAAARAWMARARASTDANALRSACEFVLARDPGNGEALSQLAEAHLQAGNVQAALEGHARLADLEGRPRPALFENAFLDPARARAKEPYVHRLHDVILETERCAVFDGDKVYIRETSGTNLENHPGLSVQATPGRGHFLIARPEPTASLEAPCALIGTDGAQNFGHWLIRNVLKLYLLEQAGVPPSVPLLMNEGLRPYQADMLALLDIPKSRWLLVPRGVVLRCRELVVPVMLRNHPRMHLAIEWLRGRIAQCLAPADEANDLLFVSRRDSKYHVLLNEPEVETLLAARGFRSVVLSELPFAEQVRAFSRARVVVGAVGAGLSNLMFAPPHASVIEITNTHLRHMGENRAICEQRGLSYREIVSSDYAASQTTTLEPYFDYTVDLEILGRTLKEAMDAAAAAPGPAQIRR